MLKLRSKSISIAPFALTSFILLLLVSGCKQQQALPTVAAKPLPAVYADQGDTANAAILPYRSFFRDLQLVSLVDTAVSRNLDLLIAIQRIQTAQANVLLNKGMLKPTVSGGVITAIRRYGLYTMDGAGNIATEIERGRIVPIDLPDYSIGLQAAWEVDIWGKLNSRKRASVAKFLATVEGKNLVTTNLVAEVAMAYYELQTLDNQATVLSETIVLQENALQTVRIQKLANATNELAIEQFEALLLHSRALRAQVNQDILNRETYINQLLGRYPQPIQRDTLNMAQGFPILINAGSPSGLLANRPDIRQAERELQSVKAGVAAARAAFYPSLNLIGGVGLQAYNTGLLFTTPQSLAYSLVGGLTAPLLNRSAIQSEFNRANSLQVEALYNYQRIILNGYAEVYIQLNNLRNLEQVYRFKSEQTAVLNRSINTSNILLRTGRASYLEVLIAQQNALRTKLELAESRNRQYQSTVNLYRALGGGWK